MDKYLIFDNMIILCIKSIVVVIGNGELWRKSNGV